MLVLPLQNIPSCITSPNSERPSLSPSSLGISLMHSILSPLLCSACPEPVYGRRNGVRHLVQRAFFSRPTRPQPLFQRKLTLFCFTVGHQGSHTPEPRGIHGSLQVSGLTTLAVSSMLLIGTTTQPARHGSASSATTSPPTCPPAPKAAASAL